MPAASPRPGVIILFTTEQKVIEKRMNRIEVGADLRASLRTKVAESEALFMGHSPSTASSKDSATGD
jgi:hypothetical protein